MSISFIFVLATKPITHDIGDVAQSAIVYPKASTQKGNEHFGRSFHFTRKVRRSKTMMKSPYTRSKLKLSLSTVPEALDGTLSQAFLETDDSFDASMMDSPFAARLEDKFDGVVSNSGLGYVHETIQNKLLPLLLYSNDKLEVQTCLEQLAHVCGCEQTSYYRRIVFNANGQAAIVRAMRKWRKSPDVLKEACRALHNAGMCSNFRDAAKKSGSLDSIIWSMKEYPNDKVVQFRGIGALLTMCYAKRNADYVVTQSGGLATIIAAMRNFRDSVSIQHWASMALIKLSEWNDFNVALVNAGGVEALRAAIRLDSINNSSSGNETDLQHKARSALQRLAA